MRPAKQAAAGYGINDVSRQDGREYSMRGIYTSVNEIRRKVFAEVARLSYNYTDGDLSEMEQIPYRRSS